MATQYSLETTEHFTRLISATSVTRISYMTFILMLVVTSWNELEGVGLNNTVVS
jgi:hypothetical protein